MQLSEILGVVQKQTRIVKARKNLLFTFGATPLPYVCIAEDASGSVVREGVVTVDKPQIVLPFADEPSFSGFANSDNDEKMLPALLARKIQMSAGRYQNQHNKLYIVDDAVDNVAKDIVGRLQNDNDIKTGVIIVPESYWSLGLLIYVAAQTSRSAPANIAEHLERRAAIG